MVLSAILIAIGFNATPGLDFDVRRGESLRAEAEQLAQPNCGLQDRAGVSTAKLCKVKRAGAALERRSLREQCRVENKCVVLHVCGKACEQ